MTFTLRESRDKYIMHTIVKKGEGLSVRPYERWDLGNNSLQFGIWHVDS